jgi:diguanylate cyclase (GGDEF)-like protein/PAS domain S-box-containing protein
MGLALAMAVYTAVYRAIPGHPAPAYVRPAALAVAAGLALLAGTQVAPRYRDSRRFAQGCFLADAVAVLGTVALYSFDPRRYLLALIVVVQAEGGMVLGLPGALWAWAGTSLAYGGLELQAAAASDTSTGLAEVTLRVAVGLLLALGGGFLSSELSGERTRRLSERERELRRVQEAEAKYRLLVEQIPVVTYMEAGDRGGAMLYVSPRVEEVLGYPPEAWTDSPGLWARLLYPEDRDRVLAEAVRCSQTGQPFRAEYRMTRRDGEVVWVRDEASVLEGEEGEPRLWQGVMVDITERKLAEERVAFLAYHDNLTGLPNRVMFENLLDLALARARRSDLSVAVLYMDLDNFKLINDSLGHAAGDELLRQVAERLRAAVRETDVVARHGGDEFLVLLADLERGAGADGAPRAAELARLVAARIHEALRAPFEVAGTEFAVTASIGVSVYPQGARDAQGLLKQADAAMYRAKEAFPGGTMVYTASQADLVDRLSLASRLRQAATAGDWTLRFQPIVELAGGRVVAVEALIRWRQPGGRLVGPEAFIPLAEDMGLTAAIGDWVAEAVCRQAREWRDRGVSLDVAFNLSPRQLWQPGSVQRLMDLVGEAGLEPGTLIVEITESAAMRDPERTQRVLADLRARGIVLALDDFGTGYSSLARLKELPLDVLKIDPRFVRDLTTDPRTAGVVRAVVELALSLGLEPVAEGIESVEQVRQLVEMGCRLGQGYHFSAPLPADVVPELLEGGAHRLGNAG